MACHDASIGSTISQILARLCTLPWHFAFDTQPPASFYLSYLMEPAFEPAPEAQEAWTWIYMETPWFSGPLQVPSAALEQWHNNTFGTNFDPQNPQGTVPPIATPPVNLTTRRPAIIHGIPGYAKASTLAATRAPVMPTLHRQLQRTTRATPPAASSSDPPAASIYDPTPSTHYSMNPALLEIRWDRTGWGNGPWRPFYTDNAVDPDGNPLHHAEETSNTAFSSAASTPMPALTEPTTSTQAEPILPPEEADLDATSHRFTTWDNYTTWRDYNYQDGRWETQDSGLRTVHGAASQTALGTTPPTSPPPSEAPPTTQSAAPPPEVTPSPANPAEDTNVWADWQAPPHQPTTATWTFMPHTDIHYDADHD